MTWRTPPRLLHTLILGRKTLNPLQTSCSPTRCSKWLRVQTAYQCLVCGVTSAIGSRVAVASVMQRLHLDYKLAPSCHSSPSINRCKYGRKNPLQSGRKLSLGVEEGLF